MSNEAFKSELSMFSTRDDLIDAQAERVKELETKVSAYDKWLSEGVYYTTAEAFELHDGYNSKIAQLQLDKQKLRDALDRLARLGNEPNFGNSVGNVIAREALGETKRIAICKEALEQPVVNKSLTVQKPLSDEAIEELEAQFTVYWTNGTGHYFDYKAFARAIEKRILQGI